ncbi:MAG: hypothetical protein R6X18_12770 [Chloroflexota bacterium]
MTELFHILRTRLFEKLPRDGEINEIAQGYAVGQSMSPLPARWPAGQRWNQPALGPATKRPAERLVIAAPVSCTDFKRDGDTITDFKPISQRLGMAAGTIV